MMRSTAWTARSAAAAGLLALGALALGSPAFATTAPQYGNIDPTASGSITVHLHQHQSIAGDPAGTPSTANAIEGVVFTAYKLTNFSVTSSGNWDALSKLTVPATACDAASPSLTGWTLGTGQALSPTDGSGVTQLSLTNPNPGTANAGLGAYLVCQTPNPAKVTDKAAPFVVTVPFPDNQATAPSNTGGWLYDVHAYPKNSVVPTITKTPIKQSELGLGGTASYSVVTDVPRIEAGNQFTSYTITDPMDSRFTTPSVVEVELNGVALSAGQDYTVVTDRNVVMAHFTQKGLQLLKTSGGQKIATVFSAEVGSLGSGQSAGKIENFAYLTTGNQTLTTPPAAPQTPVLAVNPTPQKPFADGVVPTAASAPATQLWGDVRVLKVDAAATQSTVPLEGAEFAVYEAADPYPTGECATETREGSAPINADGQTTFASNASGVVSIPGLFVADSSNASANSRCYVLVETKAPAGFVLPSNGAERTAVKVTAGLAASGVYTATIANTKNTMPALPLTGASGQIALITVGAGLVLVAVGAALVARRRRAEPAEQSID